VFAPPAVAVPRCFPFWASPTRLALRPEQQSGWDQLDRPAYDDAGWQQGVSLLAFENNTAITPLVHTA
jgi:hypothetical protein